MYLFLIIIIISIIIILLYFRNNTQYGGSRHAIFSRFKYLPQYPFISQLDIDNTDVLSKKYTSKSPLIYLAGRPYRSYDTKQSTWINPWHFPQEINMYCIQDATNRCNERLQGKGIIKDEKDKMSGKAISNPRDIVRTTECFNTHYERCSNVALSK